MRANNIARYIFIKKYAPIILEVIDVYVEAEKHCLIVEC